MNAFISQHILYLCTILNEIPGNHWSYIAHLSAELEQTWNYKSTQCSVSCHPYRSIRNKSDPVIKMVKVNPGSSFEKKSPRHRHTTTWCKSWQHVKAFIIPIILYQFQKDPFCLIILLYDILFYYIHVYKAPEQEETTLGDNYFDASRKVFDHWLHVSNNSSFLWFYVHWPWFYTCT